MKKFCQKCGAEIPEGSPVCRSCFEPVKPEGFFSRLLRIFGGSRVSVEKKASPSGFKINLKVTKRFKIRDPRTGQMREYHSLDEVPEEYREKIKHAMESTTAGKIANTITVTDAYGKVQTYHSVDEMPPDMRALYEKAQRQGSPS